MWATEAAAVVDCYVYTIQAGRVDVHPILRGSGAARLPLGANAGILDEVKKRIERSPDALVQDRLPLTASVNVAAPKHENYDVAILGLRPDTAALRRTLAKNLGAYFDALRAENIALNQTGPSCAISRRAVETLTDNLTVAAGSSFDRIEIRLNNGLVIPERRKIPIATIVSLRSLTINGTKVPL